MLFPVLLSFVVCVVALVITLKLTAANDEEYDSKKSMKHMSWIYFLVFPIILVVVLLLWWIAELMS
ncbi:BshB3 potential contributor to bacillithiol synthesis [Halalkalibacter sp. APA_J-10(15)]|uniref:BshB3 potential contributor to bacillithiol synthesis n=1 Tax=unclassified Halalkalibacter TaxID=2893063 RepID=UPI001FF4550F|nr:BshB3 potential contributor to bacillithiol synthesis [Halalkalibacter sp. APA_J-10(15)]MCK0473071.1 BshB3 potential contributor to bacillithiol synthesis [Halalkalibacter sp. APA_J-10(15)]